MLETMRQKTLRKVYVVPAVCNNYLQILKCTAVVWARTSRIGGRSVAGFYAAYRTSEPFVSLWLPLNRASVTSVVAVVVARSQVDSNR